MDSYISAEFGTEFDTITIKTYTFSSEMACRIAVAGILTSTREKSTQLTHTQAYMWACMNLCLHAMRYISNAN